ncbi:unnamed protein product [Orchesella dallaii]|uniref:Uncharacterized protein n=1 Tax=Orchesella dallaii TaxID=48710 RepID=A0ABP1RB85_9HEXA
MNSRIRKREKKEETHSHHQNHQPDSRKGAEELTGDSKSNFSLASSPPSVFGSMNTPIMQKPTKSLLQQPATQPPPFRPLIPPSQLLFPGLPRLETEGLKIFDQEPFLPSPGEPQNWSHYQGYRVYRFGLSENNIGG